VALSSTDTGDTNEWYLFNDFLVRQTNKEDTLRFDPSWKLPSVLAYQLKSASHLIDDTWKSHLDTSLLYGRWSPIQEERPDEFRVLSPNETPHEGTPVGIDAEFVSLQREEIEIKADGKRETIRPSRMGLARVSVLRGEPAAEDADEFGLPFIDDYITISEPVVDYLTAYSGIRPGDLDRATSRHALVSLKNAYKKLWLLLNLGVVFVGHGLLKDFRTINIHVPKAQVIDTVDLFYLPARQRKISLRFLASLLLGEDIQTDMHDSIEDARTALRLWLRYQEIKERGEVEETLEWIYKTGYETGWKAEGGAKNDFGPSGAITPFGRNTPEPGVRPSSSGIFDGSQSGTNTPVRRAHLATLSPPPR
jgi:PAB-dependent poly(A)-specific ribonuclease subunit 2